MGPTGSGLGYPTWPRCTDASFVPTPELVGHGVIEFGNRTLTFLLTARRRSRRMVLVLRSPRRDLRPLAVLSFLGIPDGQPDAVIEINTACSPHRTGTREPYLAALGGRLHAVAAFEDQSSALH